MPPLVGRPSTSYAPLQLSPMPCKLTTREGNYCLIVNRIEKKLSRTKRPDRAPTYGGPVRSSRSKRSTASLRSMPCGGSRFNSSKVQGRINLTRNFHVSGILETSKREIVGAGTRRVNCSRPVYQVFVAADANDGRSRASVRVT